MFSNVFKCTTNCTGRADNQLIATRHSCEVKGCSTIMVCGRRTQPLLMMAIQITHKQESGKISEAYRAAKKYRIYYYCIIPLMIAR